MKHKKKGSCNFQKSSCMTQAIGLNPKHLNSQDVLVKPIVLEE